MTDPDDEPWPARICDPRAFTYPMVMLTFTAVRNVFVT